MLAEFCLSLIPVIAMISGVSMLWGSEWRRVRCAHDAFKKTHAELIGIQTHRLSGVRVAQDQYGVQGEAQCGTMIEKVTLPWLDPEHPR